MKRWIFAAVLLVFLLPHKALAEFDTTISGFDEFNEYVSSLASGENPFTAQKVISDLLNAVFKEITASKEFSVQIITIALIGGLLKLLEREATSEAAHFATYAAMSGAVAKLMLEAVGCGGDTIHSLCEFILKLAPILLGLSAAGGAAGSAAAFSPILSGAVYLLTLATDKLITPMIYASALLAVVGNISERVRLSSFDRLLRTVTRRILTALLTVFTGLCALYGFNAPQADALAAKAARFALGSLVPVVGGLLADTVTTVMGGTRILKNAVGSAGMICIVLLCAAPIIKVWVIWFLMRFCAAVIEPLGESRAVCMLSEASESVATVFSVMICSAMLFLITIGIILASTGIV